METMERQADQYQSSNKMVSMDIWRCAYACHADKLHSSFAFDIDTNIVCSGSRFRFSSTKFSVCLIKILIKKMKNSNFSALLLAGVLTAGMGMTSCSNEDEVINSVDTRAARSITVSGVINTNTTWNYDEVTLDGKVYVTGGATLTIPAGTKIIGKYNADPAQASALVITRDGMIDARGTVSNPIVMTAESGHQTPGGWGGLVILGDAPINQSGAQSIEGITADNLPAGVDITYGGSNANDNSGVIQYVRVEYAGANVSQDNELNAFTFGGVGAGTTFDHCQAYYGEDDGFEFFGGTVNGKYLVSTSTHDDAFDFDFGYRGKLQFLVATVDASGDLFTKDPNGIECDNDGDGSTLTPFTHPTISNLTVVGTTNGLVAGSANESITNGLKSAANFRRNCQFTLVNSILYGYPTGILCETSNSNVFKNNIVDGVSANYSGITPDATNLNREPENIGLANAWGDYKSLNDFRPETSPAIDHADFSMLDSWFTETEYVGAVPSSGANWLYVGSWVR